MRSRFIEEHALFRPGNGSLAHTEDVAIGVAEPGATGRSDRGDEVDRLGRLVLLERDTASGQLTNDGLDVVDLEVADGLTHVGLSAPDGDLRPVPRPEPDRERLLVEHRQTKL